MKLLYKKTKWLKRSSRLSRKRNKRHTQHTRTTSDTTPVSNLPHGTPRQSHYRIAVPGNFDLISNTVEVNKFLYDLKRAIAWNPYVLIDMRNVSHISLDASTCLLVLLQNRHQQTQRHVSGNFPLNEEVRNQWVGMGFFEHMNTSFPNEPVIDGTTIVCNGIELDTVSIRRTIVTAVERLLERELTLNDPDQVYILRLVTRIISLCKDLTINVTEHASRDQQKKCRWWLSIYPDKEDESLCICIADAGVGILESNPVRVWKRKLSLAQNLQRFPLWFYNDAQILRRAISGKIKFTSTDQTYRGNGLKSVGSLAKEQFISDLHVFSNRVAGNIVRGNFARIPYPSIGTVYVLKTKRSLWKAPLQ